MSEEVRQAIRAMGSAVTPQMIGESLALYAKTAPKPDEARVERDHVYGEHERHRLDLFLPAGEVSGAPVLLYVHGGGFIQGDKGAPGAPFYNNVGAWAAANGLIGATMTYRLAPGHQWPAGPEDIAAAVEWLRANVASRSGDPERIFISGQSAGGAHVASYVAMTELHGAGPPVAGAIMLSGFYDPSRAHHSPFEQAYYGTDESRFAAQSSLPGLIASEIPLLFSLAEYDPENFQTQAALLVADWFAAKKQLPRLLYQPDCNHMSAALGLGRDGDPLSDELLQFIRKFG